MTRKPRTKVADSEHRVTTLLHDLLDDPKDFSKHVDRATASFASIALFGQRAKSHDDFWATVSRLSGAFHTQCNNWCRALTRLWKRYDQTPLIT